MSERYTKFVAAKLQKSGFTDVQIIPEEDEEFGADLLAVSKSGAKVCIKCCYSSQPVNASAVQTVLGAKQYYKCNAAMIVTNSTFTEKAKTYAAENRVILKESIALPQTQNTAVSSSATAQPQKIEKTLVSEAPSVKNHKLTTCKICRSAIAKNAKVCPVCGAKNKKPIYKKVWFWLIVAFIFLWSIGISKDNDEIVEQQNPNAVSTTKSENTENSANDKLTVKSLDTTDYLKIDADLLFEYGSYMDSKNVVTVITVADTDDNLLKAKTDNNDSFFFSLNCEFENENDIKAVEKDDVITVAGTIDSAASVTQTVILKNCSIIGTGEIAQELKDSTSEQKATVEQFKQAYEAQITADLAQERSDYINQCTELSYSDIERNPDTYKGTYTKISGSVIQVSEGWFNSVTLRVDCSGNIWYVTYTREDDESRILEGDWITCYGECDGIHSYTSVLGSQVTIPSLKMKYYE